MGKLPCGRVLLDFSLGRDICFVVPLTQLVFCHVQRWRAWSIDCSLKVLLCGFRFGLYWNTNCNRKRRKWSQDQTFFVQGHCCASVEWEKKGPPNLGEKKTAITQQFSCPKPNPSMQSKSPSLIISFYFQISSACSKFPKPHNFHYKCVWIQITVSCFQEASQKLNLPSSAVPRAVISLADHRQ